MVEMCCCSMVEMCCSEVSPVLWCPPRDSPRSHWIAMAANAAAAAAPVVNAGGAQLTAYDDGCPAARTSTRSKARRRSSRRWRRCGAAAQLAMERWRWSAGDGAPAMERRRAEALERQLGEERAARRQEQQQQI